MYSPDGPPRSPERIVRVGMRLDERFPIEFKADGLKFASTTGWGDVTGGDPPWVVWARKTGFTEDEAGVKAVADFDSMGHPGIEFTADGLWRITWETAVSKGSGWAASPYDETDTGYNSTPPDAHNHKYDRFDFAKAALAFVGKFELAGPVVIERLQLYTIVLDAILADGCLGTSPAPIGVKVEALINLASGTKAGCHLRTGEIIGSRGIQVHQSVTKLIVERAGDMTGSAETS